MPSASVSGGKMLQPNPTNFDFSQVIELRKALSSSSPYCDAGLKSRLRSYREGLDSDVDNVVISASRAVPPIVADHPPPRPHRRSIE